MKEVCTTLQGIGLAREGLEVLCSLQTPTKSNCSLDTKRQKAAEGGHFRNISAQLIQSSSSKTNLVPSHTRARDANGKRPTGGIGHWEGGMRSGYARECMSKSGVEPQNLRCHIVTQRHVVVFVLDNDLVLWLWLTRSNEGMEIPYPKKTSGVRSFLAGSIMIPAKGVRGTVSPSLSNMIIFHID